MMNVPVDADLLRKESRTFNALARNPDGLGGAHNARDANFLTFHCFGDFWMDALGNLGKNGLRSART